MPYLTILQCIATVWHGRKPESLQAHSLKHVPKCSRILVNAGKHVARVCQEILLTENSPKTTRRDLRLAVNHVLASLLFYVGRMGTRIEATSIRADLEIPETVACLVRWLRAPSSASKQERPGKTELGRSRQKLQKGRTSPAKEV